MGPPVGFDTGMWMRYFASDPHHEGELQIGDAADPRIVLVVALAEHRVIKGSLGGGYWMVLAVDTPPVAMYCGYDSSRRLVGALPWVQGLGGPPEPVRTPQSCPDVAPRTDGG